jgi:hypothetical protein
MDYHRATLHTSIHCIVIILLGPGQLGLIGAAAVVHVIPESKPGPVHAKGALVPVQISIQESATLMPALILLHGAVGVYGVAAPGHATPEDNLVQGHV